MGEVEHGHGGAGPGLVNALFRVSLGGLDRVSPHPLTTVIRDGDGRYLSVERGAKKGR